MKAAQPLSGDPSRAPAARPVRRWKARVLRHRAVSPTAYELTLSRDGLAFTAGQLLTIHGRDVTEDRNYTIASGERDPVLQILFRLIPSGVLSPRLAGLTEGAELEVSAPCGEFVLRDPARPIVFVATGTGIAPCRSYLRTHPGLNLTLLHGVRTAEDLFYREEFFGHSYVPCLSADTRAGFHGRVTDYARAHAFPPDAHFYLCGANEMFYEMRDLLCARGHGPEALFTEAYYYRHEA